MLTGDWIEISLETPTRPRAQGKVALGRDDDAVSLSTPEAESSRLRSSWLLPLSVLGNLVAGALFFGALLLTPFWLDRLLTLF